MQGKGALVVGATGAIGRAVVATLLAEELRVVVAARSAARLATVPGAPEDRLAGIVEVDLGDDDSIAGCVDQAEELLGGVDVLVCCAVGKTRYGGVWGVDRADWDSQFSVKSIGTARLCAAVARHMTERRSGAIVNVIGIATDMTVTINPTGSAANSALRSFTRILAAEVAEADVRVIGISPGMVEGDRLDDFAGSRLDQIRESIPLRSIGTPEQIANIIAFVASPRASYLTGAVINVDGGMTLVR
jgi:3-oxoacyl-[acyl-carrier protein] reductase